MKPTTPTKPRVLTSLAVAVMPAMLLWLGSAAPARAVPELSLIGGTGIPGGTAMVTLQLSGDTDNEAVTAEVKIGFPDTLEFFPPVAANCPIASRLASTHGVGGVSSAGLVHPNIFLSPIPPPPPPPYPRLMDGPLLTCDLQVPLGFPLGPVTVTLQNVCLGDTNGACLDVTTMDGMVTIANATETPTATPTSIPPTATSTAPATATFTSIVGNSPTATATNTGGVGTPTDTPTSSTPGTPTSTPSTPSGSPTATSTSVSSTPTVTPSHGVPTETVTSTPTTGHRPSIQDSDSCNIVAPEHSTSTGGLALLLAPALLIWARRRRF